MQENPQREGDDKKSPEKRARPSQFKSPDSKQIIEGVERMLESEIKQAPEEGYGEGQEDLQAFIGDLQDDVGFETPRKEDLAVDEMSQVNLGDYEVLKSRKKDKPAKDKVIEIKQEIGFTQKIAIEENDRFSKIYKTSENVDNLRERLGNFLTLDNFPSLKALIIEEQNMPFNPIKFNDSNIDVLRKEDSRYSDSRHSSALKSNSIKEVFEPYGNLSLIDASKRDGFADLDNMIIEEDTAMNNMYTTIEGDIGNQLLPILEIDEEGQGAILDRIAENSMSVNELEPIEFVAKLTECGKSKFEIAKGFYSLLMAGQSGRVEIEQSEPFGKMKIIEGI